MHVETNPCADLSERYSPCARAMALATVALLLCGVFDVGRAVYSSVRLRLAVKQLAASLATDADARHRTPSALYVTERLRRLSGIRDLAAAGVRVVHSAPYTLEGAMPAATTVVNVTAMHTLRMLSPLARLVFRNGDVSVGAVQTVQVAHARLAEH
jgi:hypothetical protein